MLVERATAADLEVIYSLGYRFYKLTPFYSAGIEYDWDTVSTCINLCMDKGVALVARDHEDGPITGLCLIFVVPFPMNAHYTIASEWVFWVDEQYRKEGVGEALLTEAERLLTDAGVKLFNMVSLGHKGSERLYERLGFKATETTYMKDLDNGRN